MTSIVSRRPGKVVALRVAAAAGLVVMVAACGDSGSRAASAALDKKPEDPRLAEIYSQTCKSCHASPASGAPLTGDAGAWKPRLEKGLETLVRNTVEGYNGMPPLGSCSDCTRDDLRALIRFMSDRADSTDGQSSS